MAAGKKLTVATVAARLTSELEGLGFVRVKAKTLKLVKKINDETEIFIYPGASRHRGEVFVDPIIGVENVILRARLLSLDDSLKNSTRVCHALLGMLDTWGHFYVKTEDELEYVASRVAKSVVEVGLPIMSEFDSLEKVRKLLHDEVNGTNRSRVAVLFEKQKLRVIETH